MLNFGLTRLRLVAPRDGWPNPRAVAMASGAGRLLDGARVTASTAEACADLTHVFATTVRAALAGSLVTAMWKTPSPSSAIPMFVLPITIPSSLGKIFTS